MIKDIFTVELLKNFIIRDIYLDFLGTNHITYKSVLIR